MNWFVKFRKEQTDLDKCTRLTSMSYFDSGVTGISYEVKISFTEENSAQAEPA